MPCFFCITGRTRGTSVRRYRCGGSGLWPHMPPPTAAASTSLPGHFQIPVHTGFSRHVTESARIAFLRAPGLHLARCSGAGARVMFPGDLMLQTRCLALHTLRKRRCGDDESGDRKCDDRCLHFSVLPPWMDSPRSDLKLDPLRERPHHATVKAQHFFTARPRSASNDPVIFVARCEHHHGQNRIMVLGTSPNRDRPIGVPRQVDLMTVLNRRTGRLRNAHESTSWPTVDFNGCYIDRPNSCAVSGGCRHLRCRAFLRHHPSAERVAG